METINLLSITALALLICYYISSIQFRWRNMPPGPFVFPLGLGSLPSIWVRKPFTLATFRPWESFKDMAKEYGDIFSVTCCGTNVVVLSSNKILIEAAAHTAYNNKFENKYMTYYRTFGKELGIIFVGTPSLWTEMRKFTTRTLRDLGFGKQYSMQSIITEEANLLVQDILRTVNTKDNTGSGILSIRNNFALPLLNVLWCMVAGIRYEHNDPRLLKLMEEMLALTKSLNFVNPLEVILPLVMRVAPWIPTTCTERAKHFQNVYSLFKDIVDERKSVKDDLSEPENFIDAFLAKIEGDKSGLYTEEQLLAVMLDMFEAGGVTLNATLNYAILFLIRNPHMQQRILEEIDSVIPRSIPPTVEDTQKMPFLQAFTLETHRCANVFPLPVPRMTREEWKFRGYLIPKGTVIISNYYAVNTSEEIWGDPDKFRPERFLDTKWGDFVHDDRVRAFGFGKRICMGVNLVNSIVPIFLSVLLQNFQFSVVPEEPVPTAVPEVGAVLQPPEFSSLISIRSFNNAKD